MDADERRLPMDKLTEVVIGAAYRVSNELGVGFLEKVYENAMACELHRLGIEFTAQAPITVRHQGVVVGEYFADLLVDGRLIVELKHAKSFDDAHLAQTLNYLKATGHTLALLINFGTPKVEVRRVVRNHR